MGTIACGTFFMAVKIKDLLKFSITPLICGLLLGCTVDSSIFENSVISDGAGMSPSPGPAPTPTIFPVIQRKLAAGSRKNTALSSAQDILIWGNNYHASTGTYGMLGINSTVSVVQSTPGLTVDNGNFISVSSGETTGCALSADFRVKCWGAWAGSGSPGDTYVPTFIDAPSSTKYVDIASGSYHSCALTEYGKVHCWGDGWDGKLGNSDAAAQNSPVESFADLSFQKITAGRNHTCAIDEAGAVMCWGTNSQGQLGIGSFATPQFLAAAILDTDTYKEIDAGENTTCGITSAGVLKCWGNNSANQLANGTTTNSHTPVVVDSGTNYKKVSVGGSSGFHVCGITTADKLKCWGSNSTGQIGLGATGGTQATPIQIGTLDYLEVSANGSATCAITAASDLYCWGLNGDYQIGDGTNTTRNLPVLIMSGL